MCKMKFEIIFSRSRKKFSSKLLQKLIMLHHSIALDKCEKMQYALHYSGKRFLSNKN